MEFYTKDGLRDVAAAYGWQIGDYSYGIPKVYKWGNDGCLFIGKYCSIANEACIFLGGNHRTDFVTTYPFNAIREAASHITGHPATRGDVRIGNDVWLALNCSIYSGVTIGDGAVIAGQSVVTTDIPPYAIAAGNPARVVRYRFSEAQIEELMKAKWWDWPDEEIAQCYELLQSANIDNFIEYCRKRPIE